jgi:hypothetical protein
MVVLDDARNRLRVSICSGGAKNLRDPLFGDKSENFWVLWCFEEWIQEGILSICTNITADKASDAENLRHLLHSGKTNRSVHISDRMVDENPCVFTALNKDTSELYNELIPFDAEAAQRYSDRAVQIIKATENDELLPCISNDSSFYRCKMCGFRNQCFKKMEAECD